jgi:hypothetical protein
VGEISSHWSAEKCGNAWRRPGSVCFQGEGPKKTSSRFFVRDGRVLLQPHFGHATVSSAPGTASCWSSSEFRSGFFPFRVLGIWHRRGF